MSRLDNYIKQIRGISYNPKDISEIPLDDYLPILKANNIKEYGLDVSSLIYIHKSKIKEEQLIKKGDLLLAASSGSKDIVGKNIYFENDFNGSFGAFCKVVRPNEKINSKYLSVFFKTPIYKKHIRKLIQGANINNLKSEDINSLKIPYFKEKDQIRIAEILSQAENLISQRKESIALLDELLKSSFLEMFGDPFRNEKGWELKKLNEIVKVGTGGTPSRKRDDFYGGNINWAKTTEVKGSYIIDTEEKITELALKESNCKVYNIGTILLAMYGQGKTRGNVGFLKIPACTNQACAAIPTSNNINQIFLFELLKNSYEYLRSLARGGNQENLNLEIVGKIEIILPPIALQNQFATLVEKVEALKSDYQASLQELENMYGVLSQKAFKGELNLNKVNLEIKTPVEKQLEPSGEETKIPEITKKEIKEFKKLKNKSTDKIDITNLSIADYYGIPLDIQANRENIDFDFQEEDLFYQFLLKDHFKNESFTSNDLYKKLYNYFYHKGNMDFPNEKWKNILFKFLDATPPLLEQIFDEIDKTIKLKLTDEAFKA